MKGKNAFTKMNPFTVLEKHRFIFFEKKKKKKKKKVKYTIFVVYR